jgi:beta-glucosidase
MSTSRSPGRLGLAALAVLVAAVPWSLTAVRAGAFSPSTPRPSGHCPWVAESQRHLKAPGELATEIMHQMTLSQEVSLLILHSAPPLENTTWAIPSLCIPALSMVDGTSGIAGRVSGTTVFPAELAMGATWDRSLVSAEAAAIAQESRTKGIDAVQSPDLNIARVALGGRNFETYGEDPYLAGTLGTSFVRSLQSHGVMSVVKHLGAYTQETARVRLNQVVSPRALAEIYDRPFQMVVSHAHPAGVMCAYGDVNGVASCANPYYYSQLRKWGFHGFVRSDLMAIKNVSGAYVAGLDLIKPGSLRGMTALAQRNHAVRVAFDQAATDILRTMFARGLIAHPPTLAVSAWAQTGAHATTALRAAEESIVLLKNQHQLLPLTHVHSLAVIGDPALRMPLAVGGGSSGTMPSYLSTPWRALAQALPGTTLSYAPGGPSLPALDVLNSVQVVHGTPLKLIHPYHTKHEPGKADISIDYGPNVTDAIATATQPGVSEGWNKWQFTVRAKQTGTYQVDFQSLGDSWVYLNNRVILSSPGLHIRTINSTTVTLNAHQEYTFTARWFAVRNHHNPEFGLADVTPMIDRAVTLARRAKVAVIFAGNYNTEGADQSNLALSGDQEVLISAVARANPNTIVVLNTGGPVAMPWLGDVRAVLEAWYPGQADGQAIAAVLTGAVNPSGHLPITFPTSRFTAPNTATSSFPGESSVATFSDGLDTGYRWYQSTHTSPLFPFGYGLSYTTFTVSKEKLMAVGSNWLAHVRLTNTGERTGATVIQIYSRFPASTGEPTRLVAFARISLPAKTSREITVPISRDQLQIVDGTSPRVASGTYFFDVGFSSSQLPITYSTNVE